MKIIFSSCSKRWNIYFSWFEKGKRINCSPPPPPPPPSLWNSYVIYSGDGENFDSDDKDALKECDELDKICTLLGYIELKPSPSSGGYFGGYYSAASFAMKYLKAKEKDMKNTVVQTIKDESGIFPAVEAVINKDKE